MAHIYLKLKEEEEALDSLLKASDLDWEDASLLLAIAKVYEQQKKWSKAYHNAQFVIKIEPDNEEAHYFISRISEKLGNMEEAKWHYKQGERIAGKAKKKGKNQMPGQIIPFERKGGRE